METVKVERRVIGIIEVDSGTVVVGDPAYTLPSVADAKARHRLLGCPT